jgi:hypothetical protein
MVQDEALLHATTEYDEFCDFMKWKKRAIAAVTGLDALSKKSLISNEYIVIRELTASICDECSLQLNELRDGNHEGRVVTPVLNALMEQIRAAVESVRRGHTISDRPAYEHICRFAALHYPVASAYPPAVRFKLYDLYEFVKNDLGNL